MVALIKGSPSEGCAGGETRPGGGERVFRPIEGFQGGATMLEGPCMDRSVESSAEPWMTSGSVRGLRSVSGAADRNATSASSQTQRALDLAVSGVKGLKTLQSRALVLPTPVCATHADEQPARLPVIWVRGQQLLNCGFGLHMLVLVELDASEQHPASEVAGTPRQSPLDNPHGFVEAPVFTVRPS